MLALIVSAVAIVLLVIGIWLFVATTLAFVGDGHPTLWWDDSAQTGFEGVKSLIVGAFFTLIGGTLGYYLITALIDSRRRNRPVDDTLEREFPGVWD